MTLTLNTHGTGEGSQEFLTDEPDGTENGTKPHQLVVDLAPTAHLGWQLALTCQPRLVRAQLMTSIMPEGIRCQTFTVGSQMEQPRH